MKYARAGNVHTWALNLNDICPGFAFSIASKSLVLNVSVVFYIVLPFLVNRTRTDQKSLFLQRAIHC